MTEVKYPETLEMAMLAVQSELTNPIKTEENTFFKGSKYATLPEIRNLVTPVLAKQGLYITQFVHGDLLRTFLTHAPTGKSLFADTNLMMDKATPQGQGSAITYARRYALCAMLNIAADEDDDGQAAEKKKAEPERGGTSAKELSETWTLEQRQSKVKELLASLTVVQKDKLSDAKTYTNKIIKNLRFVGSNDLADELQIALNHAIEENK